MKYFNLYITFESSSTIYKEITKILGVKPTEKVIEKQEENKNDMWWYQIVEDDNERPIDFINLFLDILEPNFEKLAKLGINESDILIWLVYEYDKQCSLEFHPQDMKRIGLSGIIFNIDCHQIKE